MTKTHLITLVAILLAVQAGEAGVNFRSGLCASLRVNAKLEVRS